MIEGRNAHLLEVTLLGNDSGDTTGRKSSSSGSDENSQVLEELSLDLGGLETEEVGEDTDDHESFIGGIAVLRTDEKSCVGQYEKARREQEGGDDSRLHEGQERGVESERNLACWD